MFSNERTLISASAIPHYGSSKQIDTQPDRWVDRRTGRQADREVRMLIEKQDRQTGEQTGGHTMATERQTNNQARK